MKEHSVARGELTLCHEGERGEETTLPVDVVQVAVETVGQETADAHQLLGGLQLGLITYVCTYVMLIGLEI